MFTSHRFLRPGKGRVRNLTKSTCIALVLATAPIPGALTATPALADLIDADRFGSGTYRVVWSARMRGLSEAVASAGCRIDSGIETAQAQEDLMKATETFSQILAGLRFGDVSLGMPGEEVRGRTIMSLDATDAAWTPIAEAAATLSADAGASTSAAMIAENYPALVEETEALVALIKEQYTDTQRLLKSDALVLNFAARQRTLAYRLTRKMCEAAGGSADALAELSTSVDQFEQTMFALRDGFPAAGINPPPSDTVRDSLIEVLDVWQARRAVFDSTLAGQAPSADDVAQAAELAAELSTMMNVTILLYVEDYVS